MDANCDGRLERGGGELAVLRTELAPKARLVAPIVRFAQITDAHVTDEESPARVEMLDRLGSPFTSAFRPQEALSPYVLAAVTESVARFGPAAVIETGDLVDNAQANEFDQAAAILNGGIVEPDSGAPGYRGVQSASNPDPLIYRPDGDAPRYPGVLAAAQRRFPSRGLGAPWYPLSGNHDLLVQGNLAATPRTRAVALGDQKLVELRRGSVDLSGHTTLSRRLVDSLLADGLPGRTVRVPADPRRRELSPAEAIARLRLISGHGGSGRSMDDVVGLAPGVRAILLDTAPRRQGSDGVLRQGQVGWLREQLAAAGSDWVIVFSATPLLSTAGAGPAVAALDANPHVIAVVAGDVHRNSVTPRRTVVGGYWVITTSSLADYPQQARAFALWRTQGGGVALKTWMLDGAPGWRLATISRRLAYLDYQGGRPGGWAGTRRDRNAVLFR